MHTFFCSSTALVVRFGCKKCPIWSANFLTYSITPLSPNETFCPHKRTFSPVLEESFEIVSTAPEPFPVAHSRVHCLPTDPYDAVERQGCCWKICYICFVCGFLLLFSILKFVTPQVSVFLFRLISLPSDDKFITSIIYRQSADLCRGLRAPPDLRETLRRRGQLRSGCNMPQHRPSSSPCWIFSHIVHRPAPISSHPGTVHRWSEPVQRGFLWKRFAWFIL